MFVEAGITITPEIKAAMHENFAVDIANISQIEEHEAYNRMGRGKSVKSMVTTTQGGGSTVQAFRNAGLDGVAYKAIVKHYLSDFLTFGIALRPEEMRFIREGEAAQRVLVSGQGETCQDGVSLYPQNDIDFFRERRRDGGEAIRNREVLHDNGPTRRGI